MATVKRIYGDLTSPHSASWRKVLQKYAIKPVQQYAYSTGKNATDSALIIDAMDLLYTRKFDDSGWANSESVVCKGQVIFWFKPAISLGDLPTAFQVDR